MRLYSGAIVLPLKAILSIGSGGIFLAQVNLPPASLIDAAGRLTLDTALIIAVIGLWRALTALAVKSDLRIAEKDKQIIEIAIKCTETMISVMGSVRELRDAVNDLKSMIRGHER